jgi:hypothetical protein
MGVILGDDEDLWAYELLVETHAWEGKRWSACSFTSGASVNRYFGLSVPLGVWGLRLRLRHEAHWGDTPAKPPRTVHGIREYVIDGKPVKCLWVEAQVRLPAFRAVDSLSLTSGPAESVLIEGGLTREEPATLTLRMSPESNWYYAQVTQGRRKGGPGWRRAPNNRYEGSVSAALRWTGWEEEYHAQWQKRLWGDPKGGYGEEGMGPAPELLKKGWNGEGAAPVDN